VTPLRRLPPILLAAAVLAAVGQPAVAKERAPKGAVAAARARAYDHYADDGKVKVGVTLRSQVRRSWSLVTGEYGRRGLWAAWVRRTASGRYRVEIFRTRDFDPGAEPPCDIKPAFSEPEC